MNFFFFEEEEELQSFMNVAMNEFTSYLFREWLVNWFEAAAAAAASAVAAAGVFGLSEIFDLILFDQLLLADFDIHNYIYIYIFYMILFGFCF